MRVFFLATSYSYIVIFLIFVMTFYRQSPTLAVASLRAHRCAVSTAPLFAGYVLNSSLFLLDSRVRAGAATPTSDVDEALSYTPLLRQHIHVASSTSTLEKPEIRSITHAACWLRARPAARVLVTGFCDSTGSENCTDKLARKRAETLADTDRVRGGFKTNSCRHKLGFCWFMFGKDHPMPVAKS